MDCSATCSDYGDRLPWYRSAATSQDHVQCLGARCNASAITPSSLQVCGFIDLRGVLDAMAHSPVYHVLFCVVAIMVLKEVNSVVTEPYMVRAVLPVVLFSNRPRVTYRMNRFMYPRPKRTAMASGPLGTRRSPPLLDCMSHPTAHPAGVNLYLTDTF